MVVEPFEVKGASTDPLDPLTQGPTCHPMLAGYRSDRGSVDNNLTDRRERHLDAEPLARHRVGRKHALPSSARRAPGHRDFKLGASRRGNEITAHTTARKPQRFRRACTASSTSENLVAGSVDHRRVAAGVDFENDRHRAGSLLQVSASGHSLGTGTLRRNRR
jgi:hypothetical protein